MCLALYFVKDCLISLLSSVSYITKNVSGTVNVLKISNTSFSVLL